MRRAIETLAGGIVVFVVMTACSGDPNARLFEGTGSGGTGGDAGMRADTDAPVDRDVSGDGSLGAATSSGSTSSTSAAAGGHAGTGAASDGAGGTETTRDALASDAAGAPDVGHDADAPVGWCRVQYDGSFNVDAGSYSCDDWFGPRRSYCCNECVGSAGCQGCRNGVDGRCYKCPPGWIECDGHPGCETFVGEGNESLSCPRG